VSPPDVPSGEHPPEGPRATGDLPEGLSEVGASRGEKSAHSRRWTRLGTCRVEGVSESFCGGTGRKEATSACAFDPAFIFTHVYLPCDQSPSTKFFGSFGRCCLTSRRCSRFRCFRKCRSQYLRLMLIWTITTAFSGVFQPLVWLDNASGSLTEQRLVWTLLALSIAGMAGNVSAVWNRLGCRAAFG